MSWREAGVEQHPRPKRFLRAQCCPGREAVLGRGARKPAPLACALRTPASLPPPTCTCCPSLQCPIWTVHVVIILARHLPSPPPGLLGPDAPLPPGAFSQSLRVSQGWTRQLGGMLLAFFLIYLPSLCCPGKNTLPIPQQKCSGSPWVSAFKNYLMGLQQTIMYGI